MVVDGGVNRGGGIVVAVVGSDVVGSGTSSARAETDALHKEEYAASEDIATTQRHKQTLRGGAPAKRRPRRR